MSFLNFRSVFKSITAIKWVLHKSQSDKEYIVGNKVSHAQFTIWQGVNSRILKDSMSGVLFMTRKSEESFLVVDFLLLITEKGWGPKNWVVWNWILVDVFLLLITEKNGKLLLFTFQDSLTKHWHVFALSALVNFNQDHESGFASRSNFVWGAKDTSDVLKLCFDSLKISWKRPKTGKKQTKNTKSARFSPSNYCATTEPQKQTFKKYPQKE